MPARQLDHTFTIAASPSAVLDHLAEPANYVGLSPLIVSVRDVRTDDTTVRYVAVERFHVVGKWSHDNPIEVTIVRGDNDVSGTVRGPGGVRLAYRIAAEPADIGARVTDTLWLRAPLGLTRFSAGQARRVQLARACVLAARLGA